MLQFDRLKIITSSNYITMKDNSSFTTIVNNCGELSYSTFVSKTPSLVKVKLDHHHGFVYIEFTGKILGDDYPKLITRRTIADALHRVEIRCNVTLNVEAIIHDSRVLMADVTKDIDIPMTDELKQLLYMAVTNPKKWRPEIRKQNGIDVKKAVLSNSRCRERISFYCKNTELLLRRNTGFVKSLKKASDVLAYFAGKTRIEYNISSASMLQKSLRIPDTVLSTVLSSGANPILDTFNRVFEISTLTDLGTPYHREDYKRFGTLNDYLKSLLLNEFDDDIGKTEEVYRHFHSSRSNFRTKRKELVRIRNMRHIHSTEDCPSVHLADQIIKAIS